MAVKNNGNVHSIVHKYRDSVYIFSLGISNNLMLSTEVGGYTVKSNAFINIMGSSK